MCLKMFCFVDSIIVVRAEGEGYNDTRQSKYFQEKNLVILLHVSKFFITYICVTYGDRSKITYIFM